MDMGSLSLATSPGTVCLLSGSCPSAHAFARRFLQTHRRRYALALRYPSPPSGWDGDFHPASCRTCSAHRQERPPTRLPPGGEVTGKELSPIVWVCLPAAVSRC